MRGAWIRRARHWIVNRGWGGFFYEMIRRSRLLLQRDRRATGARSPAQAVHPFDEQYGVDTGGLLFGEHLDTERPEAYWATAYYGIAPSVFSAALDRLALSFSEFTFVDVGCGKGRALMLATRYAFRAAVGIELSPGLASIGRRNLERFAPEWRQPLPVTVVCGDATEIELPRGPLVILLYHPFAAPVMRRFLDRVQRSLRDEPREIWIIYANPELHPLLRSMNWLAPAWDECLPMSGEDRAADRFGSEWERIVAYRTVPATGSASPR